MNRYPPVEFWSRAPKEFEWTKLQTGEMTIVDRKGQQFVLLFHKELKIHPLINGELPDYKLVRRDVYPPVSEWSSAPAEFRWLTHHLKDGDYTIQELNLEVYVVVRRCGKLKAHLRIPFAEMGESHRMVRVERYPPIKEWREFGNQSIPLKNGEYTYVVNARTGVCLYLLARCEKTIVSYPYLDNAKFNEEGYHFVSLQ